MRSGATSPPRPTARRRRPDPSRRRAGRISTSPSTTRLCSDGRHLRQPGGTASNSGPFCCRSTPGTGRCARTSAMPGSSWAREQVLVLMGVREAGDLAQAMSAAKAKFPDAHVVVVGDSWNRYLVVTALAVGATTLPSRGRLGLAPARRPGRTSRRLPWRPTAAWAVWCPAAALDSAAARARRAGDPRQHQPRRLPPRRGRRLPRRAGQPARRGSGAVRCRSTCRLRETVSPGRRRLCGIAQFLRPSTGPPSGRRAGLFLRFSRVQFCNMQY